MCGRYTLIKLADLADIFPWARAAPDLAVPRYNIAPSQPVMALANDGTDRFGHFLWGFVPGWAKDPAIGNRMINARAEGIGDKPAFRAAYRRRRCLVPADGFYEWQAVAGSKVKRPMYITMRDGAPFAFAGLWEVWQDDKGNELPTLAIITTAPNELMATIHNRMPVIVPPERYGAWLAAGDQKPTDLDPLLVPFPAERMQATEVSRRVNSPANDRPDCIEPVKGVADDAPRGLFD